MQETTVSSLRKKIKELNEGIAIKSMNMELEDKAYTKGFAFFPYGNGLTDLTADKIPNGCIMIAGQDFGTVDYVHNDKFKERGELAEPKMKSLIKLTGSKKEVCFYTNVFLGLRHDKKMIGKNPGLKADDKPYMKICFEFFKYHVETLQPKVVIVLGKEPYNFLCRQLDKPANKIDTFKKYFEQKNMLSWNDTTIACIPHPSMWNSNVKDMQALYTFYNSVIAQ